MDEQQVCGWNRARIDSNKLMLLGDRSPRFINSLKLCAPVPRWIIIGYWMNSLHVLNESLIR